MRKITVKSGPAAGRSMAIEGDVVIGRADADLTIDDAELSRRHVVVRPVEGGVQIEDLGSTNGTVVNGRRISEPVTVSTGASIELGDTRIAVEMDREDAAVAPAAEAPAAEAPAAEAPAAEAPAARAPRSRVLIAVGVLMAVGAVAAGAVVLLGGKAEETEVRTLNARLNAPSFADPTSFQVSGVLSGEPLGRTAVVIQRRLGGNVTPGGPPAPVRGFLLVTGTDGVLSLNFNGTLAVDQSGRERLEAKGTASNGTQEYEEVKGSFRITGGRSDPDARVADYKLAGELDY